MSKTPKNPKSTEAVPIPKELSNQLAEFQKALWRIKVTEAILAGLFGLIVSFLLVFLIERFIPLPGIARLLILIAGTSLAAVFAPYWVRRWVFGHRREEQLARLISKKFPKLGDRLLGIVELQDQQQAREALSPELREAAMIHVANQAAKRDMTEALPYSRHKKLALGVVAGAAAIIFGFAVSPKAGGNALKRWLMPLSNTEHYTFTQFDTNRIPNPMVVPLGENFTFIAPLKEDSDKKPSSARARYNKQDWVQAQLDENGAYQFNFTGQEALGQITIEAGDATHQVKVTPQVRPEVQGFKATVDLPEYLQLPPLNIDLGSGSLVAVEGSNITLEGTFSRELAKAKATFTPEAPDPELTESPAVENLLEVNSLNDLKSLLAESTKLKETLTPEEPPNLEPFELDLTINGNKITSNKIPLPNNPATIPFEWVDTLGLAGVDTFDLEVSTVQDQPPSAYTQGVERNVVILAKETIEFDILNEDDFGLKEIGITWAGEKGSSKDGELAKGTLALKQGSPSSATLSERVLFSPQSYSITPQKLILRAYTEDYKPGRGRVYSEPIIVFVLTPEEHAIILKARFDRVISELEDAARREMTNLDNSERLDKTKTPEELQNPETQKQLEQLQENEEKNAEKLAEIAKEMEDIFKDAMRNEDINKETMKEMADALQNMKDLAEKDIPEAAEKLESTQNQKSTAEKAEADLKEAIEKQKKALEKMQETIEKSNDANQNFEASTFVKRLKKAASEEGGIQSSLTNAMRAKDGATLPILGISAEGDSVDPIHIRLLKELSQKQKIITIDVRWIQEDLLNFFARTQKPIHKEVYEEMQKAEVGIELDVLRKKIGKNETFTSTRLAEQWQETLNAWAKMLEGSGDEDGGGDGDGGGGDQEAKDFEFMLKVMRMVQAEQDIRSRTRSLEQMLRSLKLTTPKS